MTSVSIRPATPNDATILAALSIEVWLGTYLKQAINDAFAQYVLSDFTPERFAGTIQRGQSRLVVAEVEDGIAGFAQISGDRPAPNGISCDTEVEKLYVRPAMHRKGIGRILLSKALETCTSPVWLATNSNNTPAIRFYLMQGFIEVGETAFRLGDQAYPNTVFLRDPRAANAV
ncbi:N-acetyltransferase family protein [Ruegeria sp.]|uniref:GNAT family N-acetyltransferase n=1 Tax=Ruegeria sp. TaxID=1879320 RepID=UPI003C7C380D